MIRICINMKKIVTSDTTHFPIIHPLTSYIIYHMIIDTRRVTVGYTKLIKRDCFNDLFILQK